MTKDNPVITTTHGPIRGKQCSGLYGATYYSFEGIPYARPPLGELRFRAPQPVEPWTSVRDCLDVASKPMQKSFATGRIEGDEDCLYMNIYVKELKSAKPLPVLVYIYGGAFQNGGADRHTIGPDYFMEHDVILVTFNYRLAALGFLSLKEPGLQVPGNAGLKDQLAALRWFHENCTKFNGDPKNITLFGNSAGSASTHYQMLNPKAKGLFHKAILQSGTVYNKWSFAPQADYAYRLAKVNGYAGENTDAAVFEFLNQLPGEALVSADVLRLEDRGRDISYVFAPTIEPYEGEDCFIAKSPLELLKDSWSNEIPLILGGTSFEGLVRFPQVKANPNSVKIFKENPHLVIPHELRHTKGEVVSKELGMQMLDQHMKDEGDDDILKFLDLFSYLGFWLGFGRTTFARLAYAVQKPTYFYRFDFDSDNFNFHRLKYCGSQNRGVAHGDDLGYLFHNAEAWKLDPETDEYKTLHRLVSMWTAFATTSNPNCAAISPANWEPVTAANPLAVLNIATTVEMTEFPELAKLQSWLDLYGPEHV